MDHHEWLQTMCPLSSTILCSFLSPSVCDDSSCVCQHWTRMSPQLRAVESETIRSVMVTAGCLLCIKSAGDPSKSASGRRYSDDAFAMLSTTLSHGFTDQSSLHIRRVVVCSPLWKCTWRHSDMLCSPNLQYETARGQFNRWWSITAILLRVRQDVEISLHVNIENEVLCTYVREANRYTRNELEILCRATRDDDTPMFEDNRWQHSPLVTHVVLSNACPLSALENWWTYHAPYWLSDVHVLTVFTVPLYHTLVQCFWYGSNIVRLTTKSVKSHILQGIERTELQGWKREYLWYIRHLDITLSLGWQSHICSNQYGRREFTEVWLARWVDKDSIFKCPYNTISGLISLFKTVKSHRYVSRLEDNNSQPSNHSRGLRTINKSKLSQALIYAPVNEPVLVRFAWRSTHT